MASAGAEAVRKPGEESSAVKALWTPQPGPQANAIMADWCPLLFYGGGKFSGKSDFLLGDYLQDLETYREHWQGIIFRRSLTEFTELQLRAKEIFPKIGGEWKEQKKEWHFPRYGRTENGELLCPILRFRYLERLEDIRLYEGHSYPWIGVDELGDWEDPKAFFRLLTFNRYGRAYIPNKRVRATGNPGGRGHAWIKEYFVDPAPLGSRVLYDAELKINYMFILGTYRDNQIGLQNDPNYPDRMNRAGSKALVHALKEGDFSVISGAYFHEFCRAHLVAPCAIPHDLPRFCSLDPGGSDPFGLTWWVVADGTWAHADGVFPRNSVVCYREWYGIKPDMHASPRGLQLSVHDFARGIREREQGEKVGLRVSGHDLWHKHPTDVTAGPSWGEKLAAEHGLSFWKADISRIAGWQEFRDRLKGRGDGIPMAYWFSSCTHSIRSIPTLQHDPHNAEDVEEGDDHLADSARYFFMARARGKFIPEAEEKTDNLQNDMTFNDAIQKIAAHKERLSSSGW